MSASQSTVSELRGVGIGLRQPHAARLIEQKPAIDWLEVLTDNFFSAGGIIHQQLEALCAHYPIALHSVAMSLGSTDPIDWDYFKRIRTLKQRYQPKIISDHLCFTSFEGVQFHDLIPLPCNEETVSHVAQRIRQIQDFLDHPLLIENISSYLTYRESTMREMEFLNAVAQSADCGILLDLNNLYVNSCNHGFDAEAALSEIDWARVGQIHLGGFEDKGSYLLDAHSRKVSDPVWELFKKFAVLKPETPILIEWDNDIPSLETLLEQVKIARDALALSRCADQSQRAVKAAACHRQAMP